MKKVFYKISSACLALIVLLSTVSFTVDSHYCGDTLVDSSLFGHVETCGMEVQQQSPSSECDISKKDCCSDEQVIVEGQDTLKTSFDKLDKDQQLFVAAFIHTYINLFFESQEDLNSYRDYTPPPLVRDIQVLDQTFLI
ncbi:MULTISPECIES: HYC_CC_PP family protein [Flavobacteriaceae]|jgi:hypothetical protein|uniref:Secreted protein n=1 Tax=Lacinutrix neustonica TaxID=2980107 RepID=A0A9E8MU95_9FLAO|nr:hypothetical protein [Lacinutrix neustonica]WAC01633.1 hypothetical protein N7U66_17090 [Lacinutrix neustonica]|tara:strand:- start:52 stop:468 length:417 start_codon:yes stop_codon:yes gene_type:complete